jgi:hypothetical protein
VLIALRVCPDQAFRASNFLRALPPPTDQPIFAKQKTIQVK